MKDDLASALSPPKKWAQLIVQLQEKLNLTVAHTLFKANNDLEEALSTFSEVLRVLEC